MKKLLFLISLFISINLWAYDSSLVGYWKLDENGGVNITESVMLSTSVIRYTASWVTGIKGWAVNFDGSTGYIQSGNYSSYEIIGNITTMAWIKTTDTQGGIISKISETTPYWGYAMSVGGNLTTGKLGFLVSSVSLSWKLSNASVNNGKWNHIAATLNGAVVKLYINGQLDSTQIGIALSSSTTTLLRIGAQQNTGNFFKGIIDDVYLYNRALTTGEIQNYYYKTLGRRNSTE